jgi:hypothetical protein
MLLEFSLKILKRWVVEPVVVNTVSKCRVSVSTDKKALGLEVKDSFLQEKRKIRKTNTVVILTE